MIVSFFINIDSLRINYCESVVSTEVLPLQDKHGSTLDLFKVTNGLSSRTAYTVMRVKEKNV